MSTATTSPSRVTPTSRVLALAATEVRLILRNKTVAVTAIAVPLLLGGFWALTFLGAPARMEPVIVNLQLAVVLAMAVYVTGTQTMVARRQARVLKRMRTTGLSDSGLLAGTLAPVVGLGLLQLVIFVVIDGVAGLASPSAPAWLLLAIVAGFALALAAALATSIVTPSAERAQITTMPLTFVLLGAALAITAVPSDGWWQALIVIPGAAIGAVVEMAFTGQAWGTDLLGIPTVALVALLLVAWPYAFLSAARKRFRWDPRY